LQQILINMYKEKIMFKLVIEFFRDLIRLPSMFDELESHIISGNPQSAADVEQLEKEFYRKRQLQSLWHFKE